MSLLNFHCIVSCLPFICGEEITSKLKNILLTLQSSSCDTRSLTEIQNVKVEAAALTPTSYKGQVRGRHKQGLYHSKHPASIASSTDSLLGKGQVCHCTGDCLSILILSFLRYFTKLVYSFISLCLKYTLLGSCFLFLAVLKVVLYLLYKKKTKNSCVIS